MNCQKCGAPLEGSEFSCPKCGTRVLSPGESITAKGPSYRYAPVGKTDSKTASDSTLAFPLNLRSSTEGRSSEVRLAEGQVKGSDVPVKKLCARCLASFAEEMLYELGGSQYCERCFHAILDEKNLPVPPNREGTASRVAESVAHPPHLAAGGRRFRGLGILVLVLCLLGGLGLLVGRRWLWSGSAGGFDGLLAFRTKWGTPGRPSASSDKGPVQVAEPITLPVVKGSTVITCPVCGQRVFRAPEEAKVICGQCSRTLQFRQYELLPRLRYLARKDNSALLGLLDRTFWVRQGQEVQPGTGIMLDRFTGEGIVLTKTEIVRFVDYRLSSPPRERQRAVHLEQQVHKFRDDETTVVAVVKGTRNITCDGRGKTMTYHSTPAPIKVDTGEPHGSFLAVCPLPECWKQFRVVIRPAPPIAVTVSPGMDEVPCPVCGFVRQLSSVESGDSFVCLKCRRTVILSVERLKQIKYLGREGNAARVVRSGDDDSKSVLVTPGAEVWPGAGITFVGFREDGAATFKRTQTISFCDYSTQPPKDCKIEMPIVWTLEKPKD